MSRTPRAALMGELVGTRRVYGYGTHAAGGGALVVRGPRGALMGVGRVVGGVQEPVLFLFLMVTVVMAGVALVAVLRRPRWRLLAEQVPQEAPETVHRKGL